MTQQQSYKSLGRVEPRVSACVRPPPQTERTNYLWLRLLASRPASRGLLLQRQDFYRYSAGGGNFRVEPSFQCRDALDPLRPPRRRGRGCPLSAKAQPGAAAG